MSIVPQQSASQPSIESANLEEQVESLKRQVAALRQQLTQAQKLTALGDLVGTTTHEFNNVLMTVINYAKIGLRQKDEPTRDKAFEKILAAGNRAAKITTGILAFAATAPARSSRPIWRA